MRHFIRRSFFRVAAILTSAMFIGVGLAEAAPARAMTGALEAVPGQRSINGLDVSHWQGTIDWTQVASAGYRYAFLKATEGQTFDDPNYNTYRSNANAAGVIIGAYHYARPDSSPGDAGLEATHFTTVATPSSGDLIPVLDLEDSGGLSTSALITWVQTWLDQVAATVGVKPTIYTSPSFWQVSMGDTTQFADEGYRLLWIANWGVPQPTVPANNWGGFGWTFWQWTDCGTVPGISGCVDLDYLKASRRRAVRIP
jgi:lysozyme